MKTVLLKLSIDFAEMGDCHKLQTWARVYFET
jgi:hypothetical protein